MSHCWMENKAKQWVLSRESSPTLKLHIGSRVDTKWSTIGPPKFCAQPTKRRKLSQPKPAKVSAFSIWKINDLLLFEYEWMMKYIYVFFNHVCTGLSKLITVGGGCWSDGSGLSVPRLLMRRLLRPAFPDMVALNVCHTYFRHFLAFGKSCIILAMAFLRRPKNSGPTGLCW
jgi:hypothetical protein